MIRNWTVSNTKKKGEAPLPTLAWSDEEDDTGETLRKLNQRRIVAFEMDDELYGADISEVAEILEMIPIMPLPNVPPFILGLVNLRGTIVPVIDLRVRFGLTQKQADSNSRIIIMKAENLVVGIIVDHIRELLRLDPDSFQPPPKTVVKIDAEYFKQVAQLDDRMLIVLDITRLLTETARKSN